MVTPITDIDRRVLQKSNRFHRTVGHRSYAHVCIFKRSSSSDPIHTLLPPAVQRPIFHICSKAGLPHVYLFCQITPVQYESSDDSQDEASHYRKFIDPENK